MHLGSSNIRDGIFRVILSNLSKGHVLLMVLYIAINGLCTDTLDMVALTLFVWHKICTWPQNRSYK